MTRPRVWTCNSNNIIVTTSQVSPSVKSIEPNSVGTAAVTGLSEPGCHLRLYVSPALFLLGNFMCVMTGSTYVEESPLFGLDLMTQLLGVLFEVVARGFLFFGALQVRGKRRKPRHTH